MVRNGNNVSICIWYEMALVRNGYGTKMFFTMVRNGRYEMVMVRNDCNSFRPSPHDAPEYTHAWSERIIPLTVKYY
jgi:hypothetical protein